MTESRAMRRSDIEGIAGRAKLANLGLSSYSNTESPLDKRRPADPGLVNGVVMAYLLSEGRGKPAAAGGDRSSATWRDPGATSRHTTERWLEQPIPPS